MHKKNSAGPGDSADGKQMLVLPKLMSLMYFFIALSAYVGGEVSLGCDWLYKLVTT